MNPSKMFNVLDVSKWHLNPYQILTLGFAVLILAGTFLLMLPISSRSGQILPFIDALFTATSASCVTGLVVVDTGNYFSLFGQLVLICLIQIGGLGIMTMTTLMAVILGRRIQLSNRLLIQESLNQLTYQGVVRLVLYVIKSTLLIEFIGGSVLALRFAADYGWAGVYYGYWHAVSAFCNAGFDVFGGTEIFRYIDDPVVSLGIPAMIILGGMGFSVLSDIWQNRQWQRISVQSKVVLSMTGILLFVGTVVIFILEYTNEATLGSLSLGGKILASFFQSTTARTAGYQMFNNGSLSEASLLFMLLLMFIGASPGSTGGGIKTSTFAVSAASIWSLVRGKPEVTLFKRSVDPQLIAKSLALFFIAATMIFVVTMYLCVSEQLPMIRVAFEVVSAFATVGLSTGITPTLSAGGKFILVLMMLIGRVGIFTFAMAIALQGRKKGQLRHPQGKFTIG